MLYIHGIIGIDLGTIIGYFFLTFTIILGIIDQRVVFGRNLDKLIMGWLLLIFTNTLLHNQGLVSDSLAIISKLVILFGIVDYDFVIVAKRIRGGFNHSDSLNDEGRRVEGGLKLVIPPVKNGSFWKTKSVDWIIKQVNENLNKKKFNYLFSYKDQILSSPFSFWIFLLLS